jgi:hypothetical protein
MTLTLPTLPLSCHPLNQAPMVRSLEAGAARTAQGDLCFSYQLRGDMIRLLIPAAEAHSRGEALWEHTCFEAFVAVAGAPAYLEFNFSPSGQWAAYRFADYRQPEPGPVIAPAPRISAQLSAGRLELQATLPGAALPPAMLGAPLQIGLSAVIENTDTVEGNRSYWALHHPAARPDFHQRQGFILELTTA